MSKSTEEAWRRYLAAESQGLREQALSLLNTFLHEMMNTPPDARALWSCALAEGIVDRGEKLAVRFPLFQRLLGPNLIEGVLAGRPGCARWLAHFDQELLARGSGCEQLPIHMQSPEGLLLEALRLDANDRLALGKLVQVRASYLMYTIHEVPSGVLYGHDGATPEQCAELLSLLNDFVSNVTLLGEHARYAKLIGDCRFHFESYLDYLKTEAPRSGYRQYLSSRAAPN